MGVDTAWNAAPRLVWLKISDIRIPDVRLRSKFTKDEEDSFRYSVEVDGILQPIQVVQDSEKNVYWLVDGEHRLSITVANGEKTIPAIVRPGTLKDAVIGSAKYNLHRGKVNAGDLAEFVKYLNEELEMSYDEICREIGLKSKGYISKLVKVASNREVLSRLKRGELTVEEAYNTLEEFLQETSQASKVTEGESTMEARTTGSLKEALKTGEHFNPKKLMESLSDKDLKDTSREPKSPRRCDFCGEWMSKADFSYIIVHKGLCKQKALEAIQKASMNPRPQPSGE
ncbi:MAG: ParB/RepB/Spo0J family partition protein [Candidatus Bathyarchaeia archaeon]